MIAGAAAVTTRLLHRTEALLLVLLHDGAAL
jgi:hypothetical protein